MFQNKFTRQILVGVHVEVDEEQNIRCFRFLEQTCKYNIYFFLEINVRRINIWN